jgi:hypothetical protein
MCILSPILLNVAGAGGKSCPGCCVQGIVSKQAGSCYPTSGSSGPFVSVLLPL